MKKRIYHFFFPKGKDLPLKKFRWSVMIILQELMMCKYRSIIKYYIKPSYRKDINVLRDILSKAPLKGRKDVLIFNDINFSHEINYPKWVEKLAYNYMVNDINYKRIKVFFHEDKWIVIDGNHRLLAMKETMSPLEQVEVLILDYYKPIN